VGLFAVSLAVLVPDAVAIVIALCCRVGLTGLGSVSGSLGAIWDWGRSTVRAPLGGRDQSSGTGR